MRRFVQKNLDASFSLRKVWKAGIQFYSITLSQHTVDTGVQNRFADVIPGKQNHGSHHVVQRHGPQRIMYCLSPVGSVRFVYVPTKALRRPVVLVTHPNWNKNSFGLLSTCSDVLDDSNTRWELLSFAVCDFSPYINNQKRGHIR